MNINISLIMSCIIIMLLMNKQTTKYIYKTLIYKCIWIFVYYYLLNNCHYCRCVVK